MPSSRNLEGWVPVSAKMQDGQLWADLCLLGERRYTEPFFDDTVGACMREPFHAVFRRRVEVRSISDWLAGRQALPISGFIFHISRCGSTLLGQLLAASPEHRVISEAPPIDAALRAGAPGEVDERTRIEWLRAIVGLLGQAGHAAERRFFVKFDSWHAHDLPLIARAFPRVPWIFMTRDPVEVIVSHLRQPGAQMVPGMLGYTPAGVDPQSAWTLSRAEYCARVLGSLCEAAERQLDALPDAAGCVVDYADLRSSIRQVIWPHFALAPDLLTSEQVDAVLARDAKRPTLPFDGDSSGKQADADPAVRAAAQRWVMPAWERLVDRSRAAA